MWFLKGNCVLEIPLGPFVWIQTGVDASPKHQASFSKAPLSCEARPSQGPQLRLAALEFWGLEGVARLYMRKHEEHPFEDRPVPSVGGTPSPLRKSVPVMYGPLLHEELREQSVISPLKGS